MVWNGSLHRFLLGWYHSYLRFGEGGLLQRRSSCRTDVSTPPNRFARFALVIAVGKPFRPGSASWSAQPIGILRSEEPNWEAGAQEVLFLLFDILFTEENCSGVVSSKQVLKGLKSGGGLSLGTVVQQTTSSENVDLLPK